VIGLALHVASQGRGDRGWKGRGRRGDRSSTPRSVTREG